VSIESALEQLSEQVSLICADNRRLKRRCAELEKQVEKLSRQLKRAGEAGGEESGEGSGRGASSVNKETIKTKVEEMLAELADIG
jgi:predicted RNase H-like nuclease (RuvC/YqgF family)